MSVKPLRGIIKRGDTWTPPLESNRIREGNSLFRRETRTREWGGLQKCGVSARALL